MANSKMFDMDNNDNLHCNTLCNTLYTLCEFESLVALRFAPAYKITLLDHFIHGVSTCEIVPVLELQLVSVLCHNKVTLIFNVIAPFFASNTLLTLTCHVALQQGASSRLLASQVCQVSDEHRRRRRPLLSPFTAKYPQRCFDTRGRFPDLT